MDHFEGAEEGVIEPVKVCFIEFPETEVLELLLRESFQEVTTEGRPWRDDWDTPSASSSLCSLGLLIRLFLRRLFRFIICILSL